MGAFQEQGASARQTSACTGFEDVAEHLAKLIEAPRELRLRARAAAGDRLRDVRKQGSEQGRDFKSRFNDELSDDSGKAVLIALCESRWCAWCTDVVVESEVTRHAHATRATYSLCSQCHGTGICPQCNGRAPHTKEMCMCWWWEERGFDEGVMGRCGDCAGSGVLES